MVDGIEAVIGSDAVAVREGNGLSAKSSKAKGKDVIVRMKKTLVKRYVEGSWEKTENMLTGLFEAMMSSSLSDPPRL